MSRRPGRWAERGSAPAGALLRSLAPGACTPHDHGHGASEIAANSGDRPAWATVHAKDATVLGPNAPAISGKAAITESLNAFPPISGVKFTHATVEGTGDWARTEGTGELTMSSPGARPITDRGKSIEIWRKQADGSWKLHRDIHTSDLPLPGAP